jgi:hypothetical protein
MEEGRDVSKNWADLPWYDDVTVVKETESMWRDFASRGTYVADYPQNAGDTRISSRTRSWMEGTIAAVRRDLGEVSAGADGVFVTHVRTPVEYSRWVDVRTPDQPA